MHTWSWVDSPYRLDKALKRVYPWLSQRIIREWLERGGVTCNHQQAHAHTRICHGDVIVITDVTPLLSRYPQPNPNLPLTIIYQDQDLLIIDKPPGLPTHPLSPWETDSAVQAVLARFPELCGVGEERAPGLLHRLDNETSGVLVFARHAEAFDRLQQALRDGRWQKEYLCWVWGSLTTPCTINAPIIHANKQTMAVTGDRRSARGKAQAAITQFRPLTSTDDLHIPGCTPLWVQIETGVRHQIRVHLQSVEHPIVGDPLYTENQEIPENLGSPRMFLHAWKLTLPSPTHGAVEAISPPPFPFPAYFRQKAGISSTRTV